MDGYTLLWRFFIDGLLGVVLETAYCSIWLYRGVLTSRMALLYVPINPLYGSAGILLSLTLGGLADSPLLVFLVGLGLCTGLEFVVSLWLEQAFGAVFWDYRGRRFNIDGRVCLQSAIAWGVLSLVVVYLLDPASLRLISAVQRPVGELGLAVFTGLTVASTALTVATFRRLQRRVNALERHPLDTPESGWDRLLHRLVPDAVLVGTFPHVSLVVRYRELLRRSPRL